MCLARARSFAHNCARLPAWIQACQLSGVLLRGLRKREAQAKAEALLLPMKANILRLPAQVAPVGPSSKTPPAEPTAKVGGRRCFVGAWLLPGVWVACA